MKIAVIGTGYVGPVTGTSFSAMGNEAWRADIDEKKIKSLQNGLVPIYEPGAAVRAYDPKAGAAGRDFYLKDTPGLTYCDGKYEALKGADALPLVTEWKEFRSPVIFDGRNQYDAEIVISHGIDCYQIGVKPSLGEEER